jgi:hypothetical protein
MVVKIYIFLLYMSVFPTWNTDNTANKFKQTYLNGTFLDLQNAEVYVRGNKGIHLDTGSLTFGNPITNTLTGTTVSYISSLTSSAQTQLTALQQKTSPITYNSTYNTSDFTSDIYLNGIGLLQTRKIITDANTIEFDDVYAYTNFNNNVHIYGTLQQEYSGTTYNVGYSLADIYNIVKSLSYNSTSNVTEFSSNIIANGVAVTPTNFGYLSGLTANVNTSISTANTNITALQTKTANQTAVTTTTTYTGTHNFNGNMALITGRIFNINGTGSLVLNGPSSFIQITNGLGILTTGTIYISATELSYLDGATSNIQTQINTLTTNLSTTNTNLSTTNTNLSTTDTNVSNIQNTLTNVSFNSTTNTITIAGLVSISATVNIYDGNFLNSMSLAAGKFFTIPATAGIIAAGTTITGTQLAAFNTNATKLTNITFSSPTTKITGTTWLDGPIQLKSTWVTPVAGELGYSVNAQTTLSSSFTSGTVGNILNIALTIGVWIITWEAVVGFTGGSQTSISIGYSLTSSSSLPNVARVYQSNRSYTAQETFSSSRTETLTAATTVYLNQYCVFTGSAGINSGQITSLRATRVA